MTDNLCPCSHSVWCAPPEKYLTRQWLQALLYNCRCSTLRFHFYVFHRIKVRWKGALVLFSSSLCRVVVLSLYNGSTLFSCAQTFSSLPIGKAERGERTRVARNRTHFAHESVMNFEYVEQCRSYASPFTAFPARRWADLQRFLVSYCFSEDGKVSAGF